ncbi:transcription factor bHLH91-like [Nicotiana sylvestris]|uniref:Transcription factor bHLH91-like isoform X1 n=1 Tax=Nicotiana sylvestris TaxID=4096 RepID=A0A1U7X276_NICSY|nr:PREDICTED: transcription factor bHLH91-like isoform X1 [Nicotiana sylvestris]
MQHSYNTNNSNNSAIANSLTQEFVHESSSHQGPSFDQSNWGDISFPQFHHQLEDHHFQAPLHTDMFPLHMTCSFSFTNTTHISSDGIRDLHTADGASTSTAIYGPSLFPLNLPPNSPLIRELVHSTFGSLFNGMDTEVSGDLYQDAGEGKSRFDNGIFEFSADTSCMTKDRENKEIKHFAADRQKRVHLNDKYKALRSLVPNPTKNDRASIVGDAIMYINELKRTVNELKILVDKKMCCRDRIKRQKSGPMNSADVKLRNEVDRSSLRSSWLQRKTTNTNEVDRSSLRSSWLQRKTTNTEVDVRIVDDEVTVKLVQPKRINCLLFVSKVLDDLQLDLHHVAGGLIGDCYSFLFNSKICEGSTVYAIAIANKLIEIVDTEISPCNTTSTPLQVSTSYSSGPDLY